ncbi:MAG: M48 family metallopeptidase [Bacteriovoracaceae bacterium]|nr:M48 family metallopeptidase [Bacteriovoracaceae bacterium]
MAQESLAPIVTKMFLLFLFSKALVEAWLDMKNRGHILNCSEEVPEKFQDKISLEDHQKAADYSITKIKTSKFFKFVDLVIMLIWTLGGGLESLNTIVSGLALGSIQHGVVFFAAFALINMLLGLPQSLYTTFVIEERYGFNKTTSKIFITDMIKGLVLGSIIGLPIIAGILWIMEGLGSIWWVYGWAFLTVIQFFLIWLYPTVIAPLFNKFSPLEEGEVKERVLSLLERTGFQSKGLFVMDASMRSAHGNAYFTGFGKNKRIVFFDTLIETLDPDEVESVLAHELGHFKKKHIIKQLVKGVVFSLIGFWILGLCLNSEAFFQGHGVQTMGTHLALILFMMVSGAYTFFLTPISAYVSRKYEFEADEFASQNAKASRLISALVKMYKDNASTLTPDPTYSAFYHSHPPALIRVQFLEDLIKKGVSS